MIGDYETSKTLGSGAFGTVYLASKKNSDLLYAIKSISKSKILRSQMSQQVKKEIIIMKELKHPHVVGIYEVLMSQSFLYIVMQYLPGGELYSKITKSGKLQDSECRRYAKHLCSALEYCHSKNVCHRDIKPENILLDSNDNAVLVDFGFASIMEVENIGDTGGGQDDHHDEFTSELFFDKEEESKRALSMEGESKRMKALSTMCGTTAYMAPEILVREKYLGDKVDIWSLGVVLYVLLVGFMPFRENDYEKKNWNIPDFVNPDAANFLKSMLLLCPTERFSARRLLNHPWICDVIDHGEPWLQVRGSSNNDSFSSSEDTSEDFEESLDFEICCSKISKLNALKCVDDKMKHAGWNTRLVSEVLRASRISEHGLVMVEVTVSKTEEQTKLQVRHVNITKDLHRKYILELKDLLRSIL